MRRLALVGLVVLAGCGGAEDQAKKEVAALLRDPESAQFRDLRKAGGLVCGEVNGRNAFGAYAGYQRFVFDGLTAEIEPSRGSVSDVVQMEAHTAFLRKFNDCLAGALETETS